MLVTGGSVCLLRCVGLMYKTSNRLLSDFSALFVKAFKPLFLQNEARNEAEFGCLCCNVTRMQSGTESRGGFVLWMQKDEESMCIFFVNEYYYRQCM